MQSIIHGDCLAELRSLPSRSVDLLLTDPPYGNNTAYGMRGRRILGDEHPLVGLSALAECFRLLRLNRSAYFFLDVKHLPFVRQFVEHYTGFQIREVLVWDKMRFGMGYRFRHQHEMILVLDKGKPLYRDRGLANVLSFKRTAAREHPHEKPVELLERLILHSTDEGDVVLDPFLGSGSTGVAAHRLGRGFIGIEREEKYVRLARQRFAA